MSRNIYIHTETNFTNNSAHYSGFSSFVQAHRKIYSKLVNCPAMHKLYTQTDAYSEEEDELRRGGGVAGRSFHLFYNGLWIQHDRIRSN